MLTLAFITHARPRRRYVTKVKSPIVFNSTTKGMGDLECEIEVR